MKLFHWNMSKTLKLYGHGDIIVMAPDLETAQATALKQAETASLGYSQMGELATQSWNPEDAKEEFDDKLHQLKLDLHEDPVVYDLPQAIFINGSE
jgi:hypothetical protein